MKPAPFEYFAASSLAEALELKARYGDEARFLAGGQSLIPAMNFRLAQPAVLIDINAIDTLSRISNDHPNQISIGALVRYRALERSAAIAAAQPLLAEAVPLIAHPQIRNRGTLAGNLAHADPASELPAVMLAADALMLIQSTRGVRSVSAADFFVGLYSTALEPDEMLTRIDLPQLAPNTGCAFIEVSRRRGDYAMMGVAAMLTLTHEGNCADARLACCNAGPTPMKLVRTANALLGTRVDAATIAEASQLAPAEIDPVGNVHASAAFQRHLVSVLTRRALSLAVTRARETMAVSA